LLCSHVRQFQCGVTFLFARTHTETHKLATIPNSLPHTHNTRTRTGPRVRREVRRRRRQQGGRAGGRRAPRRRALRRRAPRHRGPRARRRRAAHRGAAQPKSSCDPQLASARSQPLNMSHEKRVSKPLLSNRNLVSSLCFQTTTWFQAFAFKPRRAPLQHGAGDC
jgi:hypothetical protein